MKKRLTMFMAALFLMVGTALAQTKVNGTVTSQDDGQPVIGATVLVVGTQVGTVTDANGKFSLTCPAGKNTLRITYVGMEPLEVSARPNMRILLTSDQKAIDEVVVLGYGSAKKLGSIVGAVKKVGNATLEKSPTANFTDALAGQVSGLSVLSSSGDPTASATIRLRGVNSINSSNTPLFILDGAPISSTLFNTLNPADIANITVLKDAASTAIYGSRAANGVIVITSKKGKLNEKVNLSLRAQYGISTPARLASQFLMRFVTLLISTASVPIGVTSCWTRALQHTRWRLPSVVVATIRRTTFLLTTTNRMVLSISLVCNVKLFVPILIRALLPG